MRPPQSTILSLVVRRIQPLTISLAITLFCFAPAGANAAKWQGGGPPQLVCAPNELRFGSIIMGQSETLLATVTNAGQTSVTLSGMKASNPQFTPSGVTFPLVLAAGQSAEVSILFAPASPGYTGGTIQFSSNASNPSLGLEVTGAGATSDGLTASPSAVSFGQVAKGSSSTVPVTLTNHRAWKVTLSGVQTNGSGFSMNGPGFPLSLTSGQSVTLNVTFAPQSTGMTGGSLFISGPEAAAIPLTGIGTAAAPTSGQLVIAPAPLNFGSVTVGTTQTLPVTVSASGGSVTVSSAISSSSQFVLSGASFPMTLAAGQNASFKVAFTPQASGTVSGSLSLASNASNSGTPESLSGNGTAPAPGQLAIAPAPLNFGSVTVGTTQTLPVTVSASGGSVTVSSAVSSSSQFVLSGASFPMTLAAGQNASFKVAFTPQASGTVSGSLSLASNASNSGTPESLSGNGTAPAPGQLAIAPAPLNFGNVPVGTTQTLPVTLSASGASVTVSSAGSSSSQFALSGASFPVTIAAGQSVSFNVAFTPQASGTVSGSLSLASNASNSGTPEPLAGVGTVTSYSVNLSWNASSDVMGYNVYRSAAANGKYSKINPSVNANTAYADSTVVSGQTYYYAATSVNSSGQESGMSTPVTAAVP
jgi:hypothetical protein